MNDSRKLRNSALVNLASLELTLRSLRAAGPDGAADLAEIHARIKALADRCPSGT